MWSPKGSNAVIHQGSDKLMSWRELLGISAKMAWREDPVSGPVSLNCLFLFQRPKTHYGTGKNSMTLKPSAPMSHIQKPDNDKLLRAVEDALTGIVYIDDCQVDDAHSAKRWAELGEMPGAIVIINTEPEEGAAE